MKTANTRLLAECKAALDSFLASSAPFRIFRTVAPRHPSPASTYHEPPRTVFILDSSYNPPSRAHASLATSALASKDTARYPRPHRLLLLFSVHNADKGAAPAAFEHRLAMMVVFAQDLAVRLGGGSVGGTGVSKKDADGIKGGAESEERVAIDIGLTTKPYYNDKSSAIADASPPPYPNDTQHIHLTGFDTITRIFNPKYYPDSTPPLAVLNPFFERHGLRVTVRPEAEGEGELQRQLGWAEDVLGQGRLEDVGGRREWTGKIEIVPAESEGLGVSSTLVRRAVEGGDWDEVDRLCLPGVGAWIQEFGLYGEESRG